MRLLLLIVLSCFTLILSAQYSGVYIAKKDDTTILALLTNNYLSQTIYKNDKYISTLGGPYEVQGTNLKLVLEYNDASPDVIGQTIDFPIVASGNDFTAGDYTYTKQKSVKQDLDGLWRITGRESNNQINKISYGDRKTIKILVDGYFQWIAINPKEKGFYGTGGGHYTFENGMYKEHILFFSRDNSRVGQELSFHGHVKDKDWHHSGKSSKGDPIHEIWTLQ